MDNLPSHPDASDQPSGSAGRGPRWSTGKTLVLIVGAVVVLVIVLHLAGIRPHH